MKDEDIDKLLTRVQRVDPPPFLLTRIEARLANARSAAVPRFRLVLAIGCFALLLLLNVTVLSSRSVGGSSANLAQAMGLDDSNQLYP